MTSHPAPPRREGYRHGNLHQALVEAGVDMARAGGPDAVVLREATRRVGVAPNAAYRHFADRAALLRAVCGEAMFQLATAMEAERSRVVAASTAADTARARLQALGIAYLRFAQDEPGLFLTAFSSADALAEGDDSDLHRPGAPTPFGLLGETLDELVDTGILPDARRHNAEFTAWSAVHGLSMLLVRGPLRKLEPAEVTALSRHLLSVIERGL